jgi:geranylgeranyl diphosphate synthase type II
MGILAGDGLINYAYETALRAFDGCQNAEEYAAVAKALQLLARCAGIYGMVGGQTADIEAEQKEMVTMDELLFIHENKTAALIQAAMMVGAVLAGASCKEVAALEKCAYNIGIAFQIQDDILDVIGSGEELGKPIGSDAENGKQTYVTIKGLEASAADVAALSEEAVAILDGFAGEHGFLKSLILELIHRTK